MRNAALVASLASSALLCASPLLSQAPESVSLFEKDAPCYGWSFDNGREFPGATGSLSVDASDSGALKLEGDFSKGGNYVEAKRALQDLDLSELSFKMKSPDAERVTVRVGDSSGQCHQIRLKLKPSQDWQRLSFPFGEFMDAKGSSSAAELVGGYEYWGGAKDGKWHGPAKYVAVLLGRTKDGASKSALSLLEILGSSKPKPAKLSSLVRLDAVEDGECDWGFSLGQEFPGASGKLEASCDSAGVSELKLSGDFSKGGAYVGIGRSLEGLNATRLKFKAKSPNASNFGIRIEDSTGQSHQRKGVQLKPDGEWSQYSFAPEELAGGEHWGGANDGKWHGPAKLVFIALGSDSSKDKAPVLLLSEIAAETLVEANVQPASFSLGFEGLASLPSSWRKEGEGELRLEGSDSFKGSSSLCFERGKELMDKPLSLALDSFKVKEGVWELSCAAKSSVHSPDSSYNGAVAFETFDSSGKRLDNVELAIASGNSPWTRYAKRVELKQGVSTGRFVLQMNKTYGKALFDDLSASYVSPSARANASVKAVKISSKALGNLLLPEEPISFEMAVECSKPLYASARELTATVSDYCGSEMAAPFKVKLSKAQGGKGVRVYKGSLDLSGLKLETGRYYEIHVSLSEPGVSEPFKEKSSFAILPPAATKSYAPKEIPFTQRDWDDRIKEYFLLSDRLGVRWCGLWSSWKAEPPYESSAPGIELCKSLGMGVVLGTPASAVEGRHKGYEKYDEKALREGAKAMVLKYKDELPIMITAGNEPHPKDDAQAKEMVAAYKAVYEGVKEADPSVQVIGSSCGPDDIFFRNGFMKYQDVYDFHVYEDPSSVRGAFKSYKELFAKYGFAKPVCSTETGLNSQGMTRRVIAIDLIKKISIFFAEGGLHVSWFDLLYPNAEEGSNGDSFNVFGSKHCLYCPRIDAIAYYNMINGICVKKFVEERRYDGLVDAFLFRDKDAKCMISLWKDKGRSEAFLPLEGVGKLRLVRLDGSSAELDAKGSGISLSIGEEPMLLFFESASLRLPSSLKASRVGVEGEIQAVVKGGATRLAVSCDGVSPEVLSLSLPPFWSSKKLQGGPKEAVFEIGAPETTDARDGRAIVQFGGGEGELLLHIPISSRIGAELLPVSFGGGGPGMRVKLKNNASTSVELKWSLSVPQEIPMAEGSFKLGDPKDFAPSFAGPSSGSISVGAKSEKDFVVGVSNFNPLNIYNARLEITDPTGRSYVKERAVGGFASAVRVQAPPVFDGKLGDPVWAKASVQLVSEERQYFRLDKARSWKGPADLSAKIRFLWDEKFLYIGVEATDDVFCNPKSDGDIWNGDGIQILADPCREQSEKPGKYDYAFALGAKGPQAWCYYSADPSSPLGECKDIVVKATPSGQGGTLVYEIAIPWSRLAPFKPAQGRNLGMGLILNEDDGPGRGSFMGWFGCAHSKQLGLNGDIVLDGPF